MTKWILALFLMISPAYAQQSKPNWLPFSIPCGPVKPLFELLADQKEMLLFTSTGTIYGINGVPYNGAGMLFTNQEKGTWTFVMRFSEELACMLSSGINFAPYDGWIPNEKDDL